MLLCGLFVFGIAVGMLSGLLGIGGGVVLVPGLILFFHLSQREAQGTSLMVLSLPICAAAAVVYYQHGYVRLPYAGMIAAGFVVGAFSGAKLIPYVPLPPLKIGFGGLLLYVGFLFVLNTQSSQSKAILPAAVTFLITRFFGHKSTPPQHFMPEPLDPHTEYHI